MKIKINSDPFNITERIKQIDKNYFIVYNNLSKKYEIHSSTQKPTFCLTIPFSQLDCRAIEVLLKSQNVDKVFAEIEEHNKKLEISNQNKILDKSKYQLAEIYNYSNSHVTNFNGNAYFNTWV